MSEYPGDPEQRTGATAAGGDEPPPEGGSWERPASERTSHGEPEHTAPITPQSAPQWNPSSAQPYAAPEQYEAPPPPPYAATPYGGAPGYPTPGPFGGFSPPAPAHPRATTSMVLGIVGLGSLLLCGVGLVVSPFAWALGQSALKEIRASQGRLGGESQARAGQIMGIIGTVLLVLVLVAVVLVVGLIASSTTGSSDFGTNA